MEKQRGIRTVGELLAALQGYASETRIAVYADAMEWELSELRLEKHGDDENRTDVLVLDAFQAYFEISS